MVNVDEPHFLAVGTEVSAKYKGAFCEAKIRKVSKNVKCKVQYSNGIVELVSDESVKGPLKVGAIIEVKCSDKKELVEATIQKIHDYSQYTVVFDDGDILCLKRTALCLKSGKHFAASATLDQLPLTHPEHINTPVCNSVGYGRRSQKLKTSLRESEEKETTAMDENDIGKVVCVESNDKKKIRDNWFPGLIVAPTAQSSVKTNIAVDFLVRSFKDGKYYTVPKKEITEFTREIAARVENPTLKTAVEKAVLYLDKDELPPHWDRDLLFGVDKNCITTDSEGVNDSDNSDEESIEEKDHFVAQLFKFMDDRNTPLNQAPMINGKDVDLYKLFKLVNNLGGFNKVSKYKQWKGIGLKIGHESTQCVKQTYQIYLHSFEDFYRKLGCTMLSHPRGVRSRSRFSRSIIRDIDKALPSSSTSAISEKKQESNGKKDNVVFKDPPITAKKSTKSSKSDKPIPIENNDENLKKNDKKKDFILSNNTFRNKPTVKWSNDTPEVKDTSKDSKTKKELKETLKKEVTETEQEIITDGTEVEKIEKKKYTRNLFGKSIRKTTKREKIEKVKSSETGLPGIRKMRTIKEQLKTFVKVMTPFKKSKRGTSTTQSQTSNKIKPDEDLPKDVPKLTRSKSKEDAPSKRKVSVLSDNTCGVQVGPSTPSGLTLENQSKSKKLDDGSDKKKYVRKKKDDNEKVILNPIPSAPVSSEVEVSDKDKDAPVAVGDNLVVYYGDKHATTYDAKVLSVCDFEGVTKYYVHYKGWNSRYDEWIDNTRIASKCKVPEPEVENDTDSPKNEQKIIDQKKMPSSSRSRRSVTPSTSNSSKKKTPFSSARPTRMCTLSDRSLSSIGKYTIRDNSDSESEYSGNLGLAKQYNKKSQQLLKPIKSEHEVVMKTEPLETDIKKKSLYPKTYPSKEVLMQRNIPKKPKSCVFKVHSNKSEEVEICEQVTLKPPHDFNFEMPSPSDTKTSNLVNEIEKTHNEDNEIDDVEMKLKMSPNHYVSSKDNSEEYDQKQEILESLKSNDDIEINSESSTPLLKSDNEDNAFYQSASEDKDQIELKIAPNVGSNISPLDDTINNESKISGTDFDLNKIRSEMKGLMPTSSNSNMDLIYNTEPFIPDKHVEIENEKPPPILVSEDVYEFKDSEPCEISSVIDEKLHKVTKQIEPPILYNFEKPVESESTEQVEIIEQNESVMSFESISNSEYFPNELETKNKAELDEESMVTANEIEHSISHSQSDNESDKSQNLVHDEIIDSIHTNDNETSQIELTESELKNEVLDLCMKPPESPPNNIFSMPETIDSILDDDDDDESKLVIAENDKIDTDYQMDTDLVTDEEQNSSNEPTEDIHTQSPSFPPSIHQSPNTNSEFNNTLTMKRESSLPKDTDDESTTSCNESIQNELIKSFEIYSHGENHQPYLDTNDDSTKSGFEFESCSKSPTEIIDDQQSIVELPMDKLSNSDKLTEFGFENKFEKKNTTILSELQCREEIVDEETLNNALVVEYNRTLEYDVQKPSTSKGYFDSIHQPSSIKDDLYKTNDSDDVRNSPVNDGQASLIKSVIFDSNVSSTARSVIFDDNIPSNNSKDGFYENNVPSKNSFYENPIPSTSKSFYSPEADSNNVLFCEETIPGSPTGTSEEQLEQEERKKAIAQSLYEDREAASTMYAMNQSFRRPIINIMDANEEKMEEYTNVLQNDTEIIDQRHLQFLAEISSRNVGIDINEPSVSEAPELELEPSVEQEVRSLEKPQTKRKNSGLEDTISKRTKAISTTPNTENYVEKPVEIKMTIPLKDGKPLVSFTPDMDTTQRQALILARMNDLRKEYIMVKTRIAVVDRRRKKIRKRIREIAKAATMNQNKQLSTVNTAK